MQASDIGSKGLVGRAGGGAGQDRDPIGATPHWRRRRRRQRPSSLAGMERSGIPVQCSALLALLGCWHAMFTSTAVCSE